MKTVILTLLQVVTGILAIVAVLVSVGTLKSQLHHARSDSCYLLRSIVVQSETPRNKARVTYFLNHGVLKDCNAYATKGIK